jgi:hypothetical protein
MDRYFTILEFADSDLSDLVYVDDEYRSYPDHEEVRRYTELFANICQLTVPPEQFSVVLDQISDYRFKNL